MSRDPNKPFFTGYKPNFFGRTDKQRADIAEAQVKQLKEDNARLTCQFTGAEQKYLTQSNVIAELRERSDKAKDRVGRLEYAYERAYKSIYANHATMNHMENTEYEEGQINGLIQASNILVKAFSTLYPLDREDTNDN